MNTNNNELELCEVTTEELQTVEGGSMYDFLMQAIAAATAANLKAAQEVVRNLQ